VIEGGGLGLFHGADVPGFENNKGNEKEAEEAVGICGDGVEEEGGWIDFERGELEAIGNDGELGGDPGGDEGDAGDGGGGGVDEVGEELTGDAEAIGERTGDTTEEDGIGEAIEKTEEAKAVDAEEEFLLGIFSFFGEESIKKGGEAATFFEKGGEGSEGEGEDDGAEIPITPADFWEEVVFKKATDGKDGRGACEKEGSSDGGEKKRERGLASDQDEHERDERREEGNEIHVRGSES